MQSKFVIGAALLAVGTVALGSVGGCESGTRGEGAGHAQRFASYNEQVAYGATVFGDRCSRCHGDAGQGSSKAPMLVGLANGALPREPRSGSKRSIEFRTAKDVAAFVTANMPPQPEVRATMTERDYWAVLAFALSANGVRREDPVGPANASGIVIHP